MRTRAIIGQIHTQATILRQTTLVIAQRFNTATHALARMGRYVPVVGAIASVISAIDTARDTVAIWEQYLIDVWRHCDNNNDTALDLAVHLAMIVSSRARPGAHAPACSRAIFFFNFLPHF